MARTFFVLLLLLTIGCAGTQTEAPTIPEFISQPGKDCVRKCETINSSCVGNCRKWQSVWTEQQINRCLTICRKKLTDYKVTSIISYD